MGELQRALLPASLPRIAGLEIAVSYEPSGRAGGDLYDLFPLDEHSQADDNLTPTRWCVFIGDAAGHNLAAAVVMAILQAVLHAHPLDVAGAANLLVYANRQLCRKGLGSFITAFLGVYDPVSRQLTYARAGHPAPLMKRSADATVSPLDAVGAYPLGIDESEVFTEAIVQLEPGDTLLLYSDGITEARDAGKNMFEQENLMRVFREGSDRPAQLIQRLREAVRRHRKGEPAEDDQTLVAVRVL